jgi:hypothetical protein
MNSNVLRRHIFIKSYIPRLLTKKWLKLNSYTPTRIKTHMSYDPRNLLNRFLHLNRLNSSINYVPSTIHPFDIYPSSLYRKNRNRLPSGEIINKIQDVPNTSAMGTEILDDLLLRQQEFLKRIRKYPSSSDDAQFIL